MWFHSQHCENETIMFIDSLRGENAQKTVSNQLLLNTYFWGTQKGYIHSYVSCKTEHNSS